MIALAGRLATWLKCMLICFDQFVACWMRGWIYVWFNGERPSADETISAWVGRNAMLEHRWALIAERVIDVIMLDGGHCRSAVVSDDRD